MDSRCSEGRPSQADLRAARVLTEAAREMGMRLEGARLRRTSSRVCLGVEHGDYNGTDLFGIGVDRFLWCAFVARADDRLRLFSVAFASEGVVEVAVDAIPPPGTVRGRWARFPFGVVATLTRAGIPLRRGMEAVIYSEIPGGGMSRSASLTLNLMLCLLDVNGIALDDRMRLATLAQAVENGYVGSPCGLLDQVMILFGRRDAGVHFSPRQGRVDYVPLGEGAPDFRFVVLDTGTERAGLETSAYVVRRRECEEIVHLLQEAGMPVSCLAEVGPAQFEAVAPRVLPPRLLRRLAYLVRANERFPRMLEAWRRGDIPTVGRLFREDGFGLRDDYEISGPELEAMCEIARSVPGVWGERMLGGGEKGAAGAIMEAAAVPAVRDAVAARYPVRFPSLATRWAVHELSIADGVSVLEGCFS